MPVTFIQPSRFGFNPQSISGLLVWYDASDTTSITPSSGAVTQWNDKSGNSRHLTPETTGPLTGSRTINSLNTLDYSGYNILKRALTNVQPLTYFVVIQSDITPNSSAINASIIRDHAGTQASIMVYSTGSASRKWATWAGSAVQQSTTAMDNSPHMLCAIFSGASSVLYLDGVSVNTGNPGTIGLIGSFQVGSASNWDGAVGEVIAYSSALSTTDRQTVESYLRSKWGTP